MIFYLHYGTYSKKTSQDAGMMFRTHVAKPNVEVSMHARVVYTFIIQVNKYSLLIK